jgi:alpha-tubulin suppressor-like RCC1 family protein
MSSPTPVNVTLSMTAQQVVTGNAHTCVLLADGSVYCFGDDTFGQMGNGRVGPRDTNHIVFPMPVDYLVSGWNNTCAGRRGTDTLYCWGADSSGQLGDGLTVDRVIYTPITSLTGLTKLSLGRDHSCAILAGGMVSCFGRNDMGQLGDGTMTNHPTPTMVMGLESAAVDVAAGENHSCAVLSTGAVRCWGANASGQLGNGTTMPSAMPVAVAGITDATAVFAMSVSTCAVRRSGEVLCWGGNSAGQLADGTTMDHSMPSSTMGLPIPSVLVGRRESACAQVFEGAIKCWGRNTDGQLGDGTMMDRASPVTVMNLP